MDIGMVDVDMEVEVEVMQEDAVPVDVEGGMLVETCSMSQDITMVIVDQEPSLLRDGVISIFFHKAFSCPFSLLYIFKRTVTQCDSQHEFILFQNLLCGSFSVYFANANPIHCMF